MDFIETYDSVKDNKLKQIEYYKRKAGGTK